MNADTYTKVVLTVIAVCLVLICLRDVRFVGEAHAVTDRREDLVKVQIVSIGEAPYLSWEALPVKIR